MMANDYILSSVTDVQQLLKGNTDSQSIAMLNNVMAETIGMAMHNAVTAQHNAQMLNSATTTSTCARILSVMGAKPPAPASPPAPGPSAASTGGETPTSPLATLPTPAAGTDPSTSPQATPGALTTGATTNASTVSESGTPVDPNHTSN